MRNITVFGSHTFVSESDGTVRSVQCNLLEGLCTFDAHVQVDKQLKLLVANSQGAW
jgi:uncharacterized protein YjhX (UPF0386 family)